MYEKIKIVLVSAVFVFVLIQSGCGGPDYRVLDHPPGGPGDSPRTPTSDPAVPTDEIPEELLGSWLMNTVDDGKRAYIEFYEYGTFMSAIIDEADGSVIAAGSGEYSVSGSYLTMEFDLDETSGTTSYILDGDTLVLDGGTYNRVADNYLDGKAN